MLPTMTNSGLHDFVGERVLARYEHPAGNSHILVVEAAS